MALSVLVVIEMLNALNRCVRVYVCTCVRVYVCVRVWGRGGLCMFGWGFESVRREVCVCVRVLLRLFLFH